MGSFLPDLPLQVIAKPPTHTYYLSFLTQRQNFLIPKRHEQKNIARIAVAVQGHSLTVMWLSSIFMIWVSECVNNYYDKISTNLHNFTTVKLHNCKTWQLDTWTRVGQWQISCLLLRSAGARFSNWRRLSPQNAATRFTGEIRTPFTATPRPVRSWWRILIVNILSDYARDF